MNLSFSVENRIDNIVDIVNELYRQNPTMTPFQRSERYKYLDTNLGYMVKTKSKVRYAIVRDADIDKVFMIIPFRNHKNNIYIVGSQEGFDFVDILFDTNNDISRLTDVFIYAINGLKKYGNTIHWDYLSSDSISVHILNECIQRKVCRISTSTLNYVSIKLPSDYDSYFSALSKSSRQNIRTAYNRVNRDAQMEFRHYAIKDLNKDVATGLHKEYAKLYRQRQKARYSKNWLRLLAKISGHYANTAFNSVDGFCSELRINDELAACMYGFVSDIEGVGSSTECKLRKMWGGGNLLCANTLHM